MLAPLGLKRFPDRRRWQRLRPHGGEADLLDRRRYELASERATSPGTHVCLPAAESRKAVDAFYTRGHLGRRATTASRACGPTTTPHYYGAFVLDPDGHKVEAAVTAG